MRHSGTSRFAIGLATSLILLVARSSIASDDFEWEGSTAEHLIAQTIDATLIRPLSIARAAIGAAFFVPVAIFASPGGKSNIDEMYEFFVTDSVDYAFRRKLGDF